MASGVSVAAPIANIWSTSSGFAWKPRRCSPGNHTTVSNFKYNDRGAAELAYISLTGFGRGRTRILEVYHGSDDSPGHALEQAW